MLRAARLEVYPRLSITCRTRSYVSGATSSFSFCTRETVETETPAALATSWIVMDLRVRRTRVMSKHLWLGIVSGNVLGNVLMIVHFLSFVKSQFSIMYGC